MPVALAAVLALGLAAAPAAAAAPPAPPPVQLQLQVQPLHRPAPPPAAWDDDAGDLARLGRLAARFDLAVIRRDARLLEQVEARVRAEIAGELDEARRERRRGAERRVGALEKARRTFADLKERTDGRSLDRKRAALAEVSQAAWAELVAVAGGHARWREVRDGDRRDERWDERWDDGYDDRRDDRYDDRYDDRRDDRRDDRYDDRRDDRRDEREGWRPPGPPPHPAVQPMRAERFDALYRAMRQEAWVDGKLRVLDTALATSDAHLSVEQVGRLLGLFSFAQEQVELVRRVRPRLADPDRGYALLDRFTFDSDKEEVRRILAP